MKKKNFLPDKEEKKTDGAIKTKNVIFKKLGKNPKLLQERIGLLMGYMNDLLGLIRNLEDQLRRTSGARIIGRTMVAGLAHDLRNPLTVINSCVQFCLENQELPPITKEYLEMIKENVEKAKKMVDKFLDFAKVNLDFKPLNLNQIIEEIWQSAFSKTKCIKVDFRADLAEDLPEIFGDPEKIDRVLSNLFLNAIQAVSQNGKRSRITVKTCFLHSENMAEISINDNGPGIPKEIQDKIFEPFFTTKKGSTGLGLHLCKYFIEQHKGKIFIESAPRGGAKVILKFPINK